MLHGWSLDHQVMLHAMELLFEKRSGWKRIYIDLPGMGKSEQQHSIQNSNDIFTSCVSIDPITGKKLRVRYLHLKEKPLVTQGSFIATGTVVGYTGGVSPEPTPENPTAGTHLHFDVNNNAKNSRITAGEAVNPQKFFPSVNFTGKTSNLE